MASWPRFVAVVCQGVCWLALAANAAALPLFGTLTERNGEVVKVIFAPLATVVPQPGDPVRFTTDMDGVVVNAGGGVVLKHEDVVVWVQLHDARPEPGMQAVIEASGKDSVAASYSGATLPSAEDAMTPDRGRAELAHVRGVLAAHAACRFGQARELADIGLGAFPHNAWLQENHATLEELEGHGQAYRAALAATYQALESGQAVVAAEHLQEAMQHASPDCGQDREVQRLLDLARQTVEQQRARAIELARQRGLANARDSEAYRAHIESERASNEAFADLLQGNVLGLLMTLHGQNDTNTRQGGAPGQTSNPAVGGQGDAWLSDLVRQNAASNADVMNRWYDSQGWPRQGSPQPGSSPPGWSQRTLDPRSLTQTPGAPTGVPGTTTSPPADGDWMQPLIERSNQDPTLQRWQESQRQGWPSATPP